MSTNAENEDYEELNNEHIEMETLQYPLPPYVLYSKYTSECVAAGTAPLPPKTPQSSYSCFGVEINPEEPMLRSLEQQGIVSFVDMNPELNSREVMLKIVDSLLCAYLKLLESLTELKPRAVINEIQNQIETLFINLHDLINKKRSHQFYESSRNYIFDAYQKDTLAVQQIEETISGICDVYREMIEAINNHEEIIKKTKSTL